MWLIFYLTFFLAYNLTFFLAFYLTFFPAFFLAFYLAFIPAFYLASIPAFYSGIHSGICSGIHLPWHVFRSRRGPVHPELAIWLGSVDVTTSWQRRKFKRRRRREDGRRKRRRGREEEEERPSPDRWGFHKHKLWQSFGYTLQCRQTWLENPRTRLAYKWETNRSKWRVVHCHGNGGTKKPTV